MPLRGIEMELGETRIRRVKMTDSMVDYVYLAEQVVESSGQYARQGDMYWKMMTLEPFSTWVAASQFLASQEAE